MTDAAIICVPARDERAVLPRLLRALAAQRASVPLRILLLANNCTDDTAALARAAGLGGALRVVEARFPAPQAHAGTARRAAMEAGAEWLRQLGARRGALLTTDADALPPPDWLQANLAALHRDDADAIGGRILPEDSTENPLPPPLRATFTRVERYWQAVRTLSDRVDPLPHDPPPRHGSHTGGSLAVTLAAFEAVGGIPCLPSGEDNAFIAALEQWGGRLRHAPEVWTTVSARLQGRAEGGMAAELQRWRHQAQAPMLLPAAQFWLAAARRRRLLRQGWGGPSAALAAATGLPEAALAALAAESRNAIAFVARAEAAFPLPPAPLQDMQEATQDLETLAEREMLAA